MTGRRGILTGSMAAGLATLLPGCSPAAILNLTVPRTGYRLEPDVAYGDLPRQRLDYYRPERPRADGRTVVFFYGGGWRQGDRGDYLFVAQALASRGIGVVIPDYRLYPDTQYPGFIEDGALATRWAADRIGTDRLFLMGHSAGAYIGAMLVARTAYLEKAGVERMRLRGFIGMSGPYDVQLRSYRWLRDVFGEAGDDAIQPIVHVAAPLPPALLLHGGDDRLVPPHNSQRMATAWRAARARADLHVYENVDHLSIVGAFADFLLGRASTRADVLAWIAAH